MCPKPFIASGRFFPGAYRPAQGFALVAVIFIMVIMSGAVLMMSRLADMQSAERTMDLMGARAQSAARSGLQWAVSQIQANGDCTGFPASFPLDAESDLGAFTLSVRCVAKSYEETGVSLSLYEVTSEAQPTGLSANRTGEYAFRRLSAIVEFEN